MTAFETADCDAGASRLAFAATTAGFALGAANAATHAHSALVRTGVAFELVELHGIIPPFLQ